MKPLIGVPTDSSMTDGVREQRCSDKYPSAVRAAAHCMPLLIPAWDWEDDLDQLLDRLDGVMLTGARSNVHPQNYGSSDLDRAAPFDIERDAVTLPLIEKTLERGMPLLAICRGFQEMNVALGGTLHPVLQQVPGRFDHRMPLTKHLDVRYGARHPIELRRDGLFHQLAGKERIMINSLHGQGIDRLADSLVAEGVALDGTIEAVSVRNARGFALGVQWHPEYRPERNPFSTSLFNAFGEAAREFAATKT